MRFSISILVMLPMLIATGETIKSHDGSFSIVHTSDHDFTFRAEVVFKKTGQHIRLEPTELSWAGHFSVSPDDRWIFRMQKTGSGDNEAYLYEVKNGEVVSRDGFALGSAAWDYFYERGGKKYSGHYHTTTRLVRWDHSHSSVEFVINGTSVDDIFEHHVNDFPMKYHLISKTFSFGQPANPVNDRPATSAQKLSPSQSSGATSRRAREDDHS